MTRALATPAAHRDTRIRDRARDAVGPRGVASFVWGDFVSQPGTVVVGAPGVWTPLPAGRAGLAVTSTTEEGIVIGGVPVDGTAILHARPEDGPTVATFSEGAEGVVFTYDDTVYALQVWNPQSDGARRFAGISAFSYDESWVVAADVVPVADGRTVAISHHRDPRPVEVPIIAEVRFERDGQEHRLSATAAGPDHDGLILLFTDSTSGDESYSSGRALRIDDPSATRVVLDFNETILLPCAFSLAWNCPIPPAGNALPVPVRAGERNAIDHEGKDLL